MNRRGSMMIELMAAAAVLAVLLTVCMQMLTVSLAQRRTVEQRQTALEEAANVMERLAAMPWDRLTDERAATMQISPEAQAALPDAELSIEMDQPADRPNAKRIVVTLDWPDRHGQPQEPIRLATWRWGE